MSRGEIKLFRARGSDPMARTGVGCCPYCQQAFLIEGAVKPAASGVEQHFEGTARAQHLQRQPAKPRKGKQLDFNDPL